MIAPIELNMNISLNLIEGKFENRCLALAVKIALYTVIPFLLVAFFEAVVKNLILYNLANAVIAVMNFIHHQCVAAPEEEHARPRH
jgi:uncharacterized protein YqhQ